jgi:hypothetical protein
MSFGRAHRLWGQAKLQLPKKPGRKRIAGGRPRPNAPTGPNQVWSHDFVFDWCANGQKLKCLTVSDEFTKEGLAIEVDGRIRSPQVIEVLSRLVSERGAPRYLRSDKGRSSSLAPAEVDRRSGHRDFADRPGQALAEWRNRKLQWQVPRRVPVAGMVPLAGRGEGADRGLAQALQRGSAPFEPGVPDTGGICGQYQKRSIRERNGADRCGEWSLRAPLRRSPPRLG